MTTNNIKTLISSNESRTLEQKKITGELKDGMHTACAFLNTEGGWLIFGVTPKHPENWSIHGDFIVVTFPRPNVPQGVPQNMDLDRWIENQIAINPKITTEELANLSGKTSKTIKRHIAKMPHIKYVGSGYSGHWKITDNSDSQ